MPALLLALGAGLLVGGLIFAFMRADREVRCSWAACDASGAASGMARIVDSKSGASSYFCARHGEMAFKLLSK